MFRPLARILAFFILYLLIFIILKPVFMVVYASIMGDITVADWFKVIYHGLPMDCSMAGYFTIVPALLTIISIWAPRSRILCAITTGYVILSSILISIVTVTDLALYGYWNFRLDTTPFFYFFSSPSSALASVSTFTAILGFIAAAILAAAIYFIIAKTVKRVPATSFHRIISTIAATLLTAALFIPIRGSLTVSTMNLSRSYFSQNQRLNHAAINPLFSLMYSATHQSDFSSQFRYFDEDRAAEIFNSLSAETTVEEPDSLQPLFSIDRPDIYIIIME
ncbi:MAG: LTA synthase family protein, partial [Muribaculaceae bacterium]|nr:LTA synthase family protein [Muribaculaceae bacterium]